MRLNYERVRLCYALSVRQNAGRKAQKVRKFPGGFALPPTLKSVKNRCEISEISEPKNRLEKRTPGGIEKIWTKILKK